MSRIEDSASRLMNSMDLSELVADKSISEKTVEIEKPSVEQTQIDSSLLDEIVEQ